MTHDGILTTVRPVGPSQLHRPYKTPLAPANGQGEIHSSCAAEQMHLHRDPCLPRGAAGHLLVCAGILSIQELVAQFSKLPAAEQTAFKQRVGAK